MTNTTGRWVLLAGLVLTSPFMVAEAASKPSHRDDHGRERNRHASATPSANRHGNTSHAGRNRGFVVRQVYGPPHNGGRPFGPGVQMPQNRGFGDNFGGFNRQANFNNNNRAAFFNNRQNTLNNFNVNANRVGMINRSTNVNNTNIVNNNTTNIINNNINRNVNINSGNVTNNVTNVNVNNINNRNFGNFNQVNVGRTGAGYGGGFGYGTGVGGFGASYGGYRTGFGGYGTGYYGGYTRSYGGWGGGYGGYGGYGYSGYGGYGGWGVPTNYSYNQSWVNGLWNTNYASGWGMNSYYSNPGNSALGVGLGIGAAAMGVSSLLNSWGYSRYSNPYYSSYNVVAAQPTVVVRQSSVYDYSRPIDISAAPLSQTAVAQATTALDAARAAFKSGDYNRALTLSEDALRQSPNDPMLHEFRAICLFALQRYDEAAIPFYTVLSVGPGWDWTTLAGLYPTIEVYTRQLRALEAFCETTPRAAAARFVLAALYLTQGSAPAAAAKLREVIALQPQDKLSAQILATLTAKPPAEAPPSEPAKPEGASPNPTAVAIASEPAANPGVAPAQASAAPTQTGGAQAQATPPAAPQPPPLPTGPVPAKLVGNWTAKPEGSVTITLGLDDKKSFNWKVAAPDGPHEFKGQATFENDTLFLAPPDHPPMVGKVAWKDDHSFQFKALGAPAEDPGLNFSNN